MIQRRLVRRVLLHQLPPHGEVEDGLAEGLDLVGAGGEGGERGEGEAGVGREGVFLGCGAGRKTGAHFSWLRSARLRIGRSQAGEAGGAQSVAGGLARGAGCL